MSPIVVDCTRDDNLTAFGKAVLSDRYLLENEDYQQLFVRVAQYYADNDEHAQRLYDYMSKLWFMPATPILSNGGTSRGLPISCFLNETEDSLVGILNLWNENVWLASRGGGIGSYWGNLRSIGERVRGSGKTSGIIPFIVVQNALTLAISQGSLRRGSSAVYLPVGHPEIEEFLDIRKPTGGDPNRKALNIHHGVLLTDEFMRAVEQDKPWDLVSPKDKCVMSTVRARDLWIKILTTRVETGEPYMVFVDTVNRHRPDIYKELGLEVKMSNLCTEIMLATGEDHLNTSRTAICCLASLNLEYYDSWASDPLFVEDIMRFLDNVLTDFINKAPPEISRARYAAVRERSIGMGVMGFHSFLQSKMIPFESFAASVWNKKVFAHLRSQADEVSLKLALEKGSCPDAIDANRVERFVHKLAIAPTASISIISGNTSPGIEPYAANVFTHKTLTGSFVVRNKFLQRLLESKGLDNEQIWSSISTNEGSVQHLDFLTEREKLVFRTAYEMDQRWIVEHSSDRAPYICQAQSVNIFLPAGVHKRYLHKIHCLAWKKGVKSLYYLRSKSVQKADKVSHMHGDQVVSPQRQITNFDYDECLACQ
ncbi:MAG: ribonucleoside-diphosphate reductase subunit alpha [Anaplasma sp.]